MKKKNIGILYMILSAFCFAVMNLFVRMSGDLPALEKSFFRNLVALIVALGILAKNKTSLRSGKGHVKDLMIRSGFGTLGIWCNFYALGHIDLADASMLNKLSPFFVLLFSYLILKEKLTFQQGFYTVLAFIGALFIIKPGFLSLSQGGGASWIGALGGMCAGMAYTYVRKLGNQGVPGPLIVFCFSTISCLASVPFLITSYQPASKAQIAMLLMAGAAAAGGQFSITAAYTYSPAREISIFDYSQIIFATLLGFMILGEIPDRYSFIGYIVIIGASIGLFLYNNRRRDTEVAA